MSSRRNLLTIGFVFALVTLLRTWIIGSGGISFDSDEAIVNLMARHITHGEPVPTFFYGQAYMGSLSAILVAGGFSLLGESVEAARIVQLALFLVTLLSGYALAQALTGSMRIAALALLIMAFPPANTTLYTSASLGGWHEVVLLGNVTLLLAWQVTVGRRRERWRWLALGLVAGLGWWTNSAIITALAVAGVLGLRHFSLKLWPHYILAAAGFILGSLPWWVYNLRHDWEALLYLFTGYGSPLSASISVGDRALGLLGLGLPALYGLREPAAQGFPLTVENLLLLPLLLILLIDFLLTLPERLRKRPTVRLRAEG